MLIVRFKETFRERMPEWALGAGMIAWGLAALFSVDLFTQQPIYEPLHAIASQYVWAWTVLIAGTARIIFLVINGAWRPSAHIRAIGCAVGSVLWGTLFVATFNLSWLSPTASIYAMLLCLDITSLWFSAGDAKRADLSAKGVLRK